MSTKLYQGSYSTFTEIEGMLAVSCSLEEGQVKFRKLSGETMYTIPYKASLTWWDVLISLKKMYLEDNAESAVQLQLICNLQHITERDWNAKIKDLLDPGVQKKTQSGHSKEGDVKKSCLKRSAHK